MGGIGPIFALHYELTDEQMCAVAKNRAKDIQGACFLKANRLKGYKSASKIAGQAFAVCKRPITSPHSERTHLRFVEPCIRLSRRYPSRQKNDNGCLISTLKGWNFVLCQSLHFTIYSLVRTFGTNVRYCNVGFATSHHWWTDVYFQRIQQPMSMVCTCASRPTFTISNLFQMALLGF